MARDRSAAAAMGTGTAPLSCAVPVVRQIEIRPQLIERTDADVLVEAQVIAYEVLENDANRSAHRLEVVVAQIDPIEQNAPFRRIVQPCEQLDERRLPRAVLANEGDALAGMQAEVHMPHAPRRRGQGSGNRRLRTRIPGVSAGAPLARQGVS